MGETKFMRLRSRLDGKWNDQDPLLPVDKGVSDWNPKLSKPKEVSADAVPASNVEAIPGVYAPLGDGRADTVEAVDEFKQRSTRIIARSEFANSLAEAKAEQLKSADLPTEADVKTALTAHDVLSSSAGPASDEPASDIKLSTPEAQQFFYEHGQTPVGLPRTEQRIITEAQQPVTMKVSTLPPSSAQPERRVVAKPVQLSPLERAKALEAEQLARGERGDGVIKPEVPQSQPAERGTIHKTEERVVGAVFNEMKTYEEQVNEGDHSTELRKKIEASRDTLQRFINSMPLQQDNIRAYRGILQKLEDLLKIVNKH